MKKLLYLLFHRSVLGGLALLAQIGILAAMVLVILDFIGDILFFRCPACGALLWQYWSGHCHSCGHYIDLKHDT